MNNNKCIYFCPRTIGLESNLECFVCGVNKRHKNSNDYLHNISGFVDSKEDVLLIVSMFKYKQRLDYRSHDPNRIQVKIRACDNHIIYLKKMLYKIRENNNISIDMINSIIEQINMMR